MSYDDPQPNPFTQRKFVTAAVVVAAVVVMALILIFINRDTDTPAATPTQNTTTSSGSNTSSSKPSTPSNANDSVCGLAPGDQTTPTTPPEATWQLVGTMAMPTSKDIGPGETSDEGIHSCYAKNPTGALFAAVAVSADSIAGVDQVTLLRTRAVPSAAVDEAIEAARQEGASVGSDMPDGYGGEQRVQVAAYQITAATDATVSLMIVLSAPNTSGYSAVPVTMQWFEGDWRMVFQETVTPVGLSSLAGYVPWGGA